MIFTIIIGNFIGTVVGMFLVNPLARATYLRPSILVPVLIVIVLTGAYAVHNSVFDIWVALAFGVLGYLMKIFDYSRAAMLIGFVLGHAIEKNLYLSLKLSGPFFFLEPIPLTLSLITLGFLGFNLWSSRSSPKKGIQN